MLIAPFGRIGMAQAAAAPAHAEMAQMPHCAGEPAPDDPRPKRHAVDCMMACAAVAPAADAVMVVAPPPRAPVHARILATTATGRGTEADLRPPRRS